MHESPAVTHLVVRPHWWTPVDHKRVQWQEGQMLSKLKYLWICHSAVHIEENTPQISTSSPVIYGAGHGWKEGTVQWPG